MTYFLIGLIGYLLGCSNLALVLVLVVLLVTLITDYIAAGTVTTILTVPPIWGSWNTT